MVAGGTTTAQQRGGCGPVPPGGPAALPQLVDAFVVCGLAHDDVRTINGDAGFCGYEARYRPSTTQTLCSTSRSNELPPQFAMVRAGWWEHRPGR